MVTLSMKVNIMNYRHIYIMLLHIHKVFMHLVTVCVYENTLHCTVAIVIMNCHNDVLLFML